MRLTSRARVSIALVLVVGVAAGVPAAFADESAELLQDVQHPASGGPVNETPTKWFVELKASPATFRSQAKSAGVSYSERYSFGELWNGVSVDVRGSNLDKLRGLASVSGLYPVLPLSLPEVTPSDPELLTALRQTGVSYAQEELGLTGAGIKVAMMDTGIDWHHPDLGGCFGAGCRVASGWDFVGDAYDANPANATYNPVLAPDADPDDCNGHGSHVAGIVGANGTVKGVAPGATLGAYRVFGCSGSTDSDVMLAAMERVLADGMNVLNISIGAAFNNWPQYPTAVGADALAARGVTVVASIGNSGANGLWAAGAPGVGRDVIGVASFENTHVTQFSISVSPDGRKLGYTPATAAPTPPQAGSLPMARTGTRTSAADACNPLAAGSLAGKAVLIRRGTCGFAVKAGNAQNAGAAAVVLYNNTTVPVTPTVAGPTPITIPVVMLRQADGNLVDARLAAGPVAMTWTATTVTAPNAGNVLSAFSSYGTDAELTLKPDLGAPGGSIWSTYPLEKGGYANVSGTSMASPHTAGAVALILEARPGSSPAGVRTLLQNTADPKPWSSGANPAGLLDHTWRQGAGMIDVPQAVQTAASVTPAKLSLGEGSGGSATLTIANSSSAPVTYTASHVPTLANGPSANPASVYPFGFSVFNLPSTATFAAASVTVPANGRATLDVTIAPNPLLVERSLYGGYVVLSSPVETLRVPYAGFKGDYQSIVAVPARTLAPGVTLPALGKEVAPGKFDLVPANEVWTLESAAETPNVLLHFAHQVARLRFQIVKASNGAPVHPVFSYSRDDRYLGRSGGPTGFFAFAWDGTRMHDNGKGTVDHRKAVADGQYKIVVTALKALGDDSNPAHHETWTSPTITIDRP